MNQITESDIKLLNKINQLSKEVNFGTINIELTVSKARVAKASITDTTTIVLL